MKLLLVEQRELFREGLARVLAEQAGVEAVETSASTAEAVKKAKEVSPDIIIIHAELEKKGCIEAIQYTSQLLPRVKILLLIRPENTVDLLSIFKAGATGYVCEDITIGDLMKAIFLTAGGRVVLLPRISKQMIMNDEFTSGTADKKEKPTDITLTSRECTVLHMIAKGATTRDVADTLVISENTVRTHLRNLMEKLHVHSRLQAVILTQETLSAMNSYETTNKPAPGAKENSKPTEVFIGES